jgi:enoyl-CoA hydratase/carnithine racemase
MPDDIVISERGDGIAVLKLNNGVTNAVSQELVDELARNINELKSDPDTRGLVLTSMSEKFFCIGLDIPSLFELQREEFTAFYKAYNCLCLDLYTLPMPTVCALKGHAIAGGCILTLCCDYRIIAEGKKLMGLNEIKLGVPVPYPADRILHDLVGSLNAREIAGTGEFYGPAEALDLGLVDMILPADEVLQFSIDKAGQLAGMDRSAFGIIKHNRIGPVLDQIRANLESREEVFVDRWYAPETREKLKEAMESF